MGDWSRPRTIRWVRAVDSMALGAAVWYRSRNVDEGGKRMANTARTYKCHLVGAVHNQFPSRQPHTNENLNQIHVGAQRERERCICEKEPRILVCITGEAKKIHYQVIAIYDGGSKTDADENEREKKIERKRDGRGKGERRDERIKRRQTGKRVSHDKVNEEVKRTRNDG